MKISMQEFLSFCNSELEELFPDIPVYGNDTMDGYSRPALFTEVVSRQFAHESRYYARNGATLKVTFLENSHDEQFCLHVYERIRERFAFSIKVNGMVLLTSGIHYEFTGERSNILQVTAEYEWMETLSRTEPEPLAEEVNLAIMKGE